ncbi:MAG TPA: DUF6666 family protein [Pirellulales bacterium]|jgi:hypothetical protein
MFTACDGEQAAETLAPESRILPTQWYAPVGPSEPATQSEPVATPVAGDMPFAGADQVTARPRLLSGFLGPGVCRANCDACPTHGLVVLVGYDAWRGITSDSWENNGIHTGLNYGTRLGEFSELTGIGFQVGASIGVYDWSGSDYRPQNTLAETQGFLTYGFFRKQNSNSNWSAALVQDWMFNNNFGVYSQSPTLSQWRTQIGYATSAKNEFGVWGSWRMSTATTTLAGVGPTTWEAINQIDLFWHHKWQFGGDTWLYVGAPLSSQLSGGGSSVGSYIADATANVPLSNCIALYTQVMYMRPAASPGPVASEEDAWNFTIGLSYYVRRNARSNTVAGQCWMPLMPLANNGNFIVDTNHH